MANEKPVFEIRIGNVRAAVWANQGKKGSWYNISVTRTYRDGNTPKDSSSFGTGDLLAAAKVLDLAHNWCLENKAAQ